MWYKRASSTGIRACAAHGLKAEDVKHGRTFHRVNIIAAVIYGNSCTEMIAPMRCQKSMTGERFENWMENNMMKCIGSGKAVIMDNARFHRKKQLQEICEKSGSGLLFLPLYSPNFNPFEKEWANMKRGLRNTAPFHALFETAVYKYWS
ncbi:MAG: transposase [Treponema sp.]|jgi:transposase|nr:transposase [Treponema sp.]